MIISRGWGCSTVSLRFREGRTVGASGGPSGGPSGGAWAEVLGWACIMNSNRCSYCLQTATAWRWYQGKRVCGLAARMKLKVFGRRGLGNNHPGAQRPWCRGPGWGSNLSAGLYSNLINKCMYRVSIRRAMHFGLMWSYITCITFFKSLQRMSLYL